MRKSEPQSPRHSSRGAGMWSIHWPCGDFNSCRIEAAGVVKTPPTHPKGALKPSAWSHEKYRSGRGLASYADGPGSVESVFGMEGLRHGTFERDSPSPLWDELHD
jgi:hypothetical protein